MAFSAASASAATLCVGPTDFAGCPIGATQYNPGTATDLATALTAASFGDTVYVYSGTYSGASTFNVPSQVDLRGVGPTKPLLRLSGLTDNQVVLNSSGSAPEFRNLAVEIPASANNTGVMSSAGSATVFGVEVTTAVGATNATGFNLQGSGVELESSSAVVPTDGNSAAVRATNATGITIDDLDATADYGIILTGSNNPNVQRANISARRGLRVANSNGATISSSLVRPASGQDSIYAAYVEATSGTTSSVSIYNCTLISSVGGFSTGVQAGSSGASSVASALVDSSVFWDYDQGFETSQSGSTTSVTASYSRYTGSNNAGAGTSISTSNTQQISGDPGFSNAAGGDYTLQRTSSLVDAGNPGALSGSSDSDLAGNPRIVSRGAGNIRDIGAYELLSRAPAPLITIKTSAPSTTSPVQFSAAGSSDPDGDAMSYSWKFDGTAFANGQDVSRLFVTEGPHSVEMTATDAIGLSATVAQQFSVAKGFLPLTIKSQNVRMDSRGRFAIRLTCPDAAASNCTGRLVFETTKKIEAKNYQDGKRKNYTSRAKILRAANYVFSVEPGTTRSLKVQSYGTFQNVLKKHKKFKLIAKMVSGTTSNSTLVSNRPTFTLSAPKKK